MPPNFSSSPSPRSLSLTEARFDYSEAHADGSQLISQPSEYMSALKVISGEAESRIAPVLAA